MDRAKTEPILLRQTKPRAEPSVRCAGVLKFLDSVMVEGAIVVSICVLLVLTLITLLFSESMSSFYVYASLVAYSLYFCEVALKACSICRPYFGVPHNVIDLILVLSGFSGNLAAVSVATITLSHMRFVFIVNILVILHRWTRVGHYYEYTRDTFNNAKDPDDIHSYLERAVHILKAFKLKNTTRPFQATQLDWVIHKMKSNELYTHRRTSEKNADKETLGWLTEFSKYNVTFSGEDESMTQDRVSRITRLKSSDAPDQDTGSVLRKRANTLSFGKLDRVSTRFVQQLDLPREQDDELDAGLELSKNKLNRQRSFRLPRGKSSEKRKKLVKNQRTKSLDPRELGKERDFAFNDTTVPETIYEHYIGETGDMLHQYLDTMHTVSFDPFDFNVRSQHRPLEGMFLITCTSKELPDKLKVPRKVLKEFIQAIEQDYISTNPYHTSLHAADVLQGIYAFTECPSFDSVITDLDRFACFVAAAVHDFKHPGRNNKFLQETWSPLALMYNDNSVLESYHLAECFKLMAQPKHHILKTLSQKDRRYARQLIIDMVLATDMSSHFNDLSVFKTLNPGQLSLKERREPSMKRKICKFALHAADISNPCRPLLIYLEWAERCMEEFFLQGDDERARKIDISPFMDRHKQNKPKCQLGFMSFIVKPMYVAWTSYLQELNEVCLANLETNKVYWEDKARKLKEIEDVEKETFEKGISATKVEVITEEEEEEEEGSDKEQ